MTSLCAVQVALSKAGSGGVGLLVSQDLVLGEGGGLEAGDSAEVKYTGWLLDGHVLGQVGRRTGGLTDTSSDGWVDGQVG